jgi:hypothetical protein
VSVLSSRKKVGGIETCPDFPRRPISALSSGRIIKYLPAEHFEVEPRNWTQRHYHSSSKPATHTPSKYRATNLPQKITKCFRLDSCATSPVLSKYAPQSHSLRRLHLYSTFRQTLQCAQMTANSAVNALNHNGVVGIGARERHRIDKIPSSPITHPISLDSFLAVS